MTIRKREILKIIVCAFLFVLYHFSSFYGNIAAAALCVCLLAQGFGLPVLAVYAAAAIGFDFSVYGLVCGVIPALGAWLAALLFGRRGRLRFVYVFAAWVFLSFLKLIFIRDVSDIGGYFAELAVFAVLSLVFFGCVRCLAERRKKPSQEETVSVCVTIVHFLLCLEPYTLFGVSVSRILVLFLLPCVLLVFGRERALVFSVLAGAAVSIYLQSPTYLGWYAAVCLVASVFYHTNEVVYGCAVLAGELLLDVFFETPGLSYFHVVFYAVAVAVFLLLIRPLRTLRTRLSDETKMSKVLLNRSRSDLSLRLKDVSDVFREMSELFEDMSGQSIPAEEAKRMLTRECFERLCLACPNGKNCLREETRLYHSLHAAVERAIEKGKITLIDVPDFLNAHCVKVNVVMSLVNQLSVSYRQYQTLSKNLDSGKQLLRSQFDGVSHIFDRLASELQCTVSADNTGETRLREYFRNNGVRCAETLIFSDQSMACAIVEGEHDNGELAQIVSRFFGTKYVVDKDQEVAAGSWCAYFKKAPRFDVIFGSAQSAKAGSEKSGDVHTLVKISDTKFLIALCDGMGSGTRAEKISSASISLVENLYRAGFSSEFILKTVNKLLITCFEECFTTLDIAVFDLGEAKCDFIKLGSADSYIKGREFARRVSCCSMPLGILEEIKPATSTETLESGDVVFLASDGVTDSFHDRDEMLEFVSSIDCVNPQECAGILLDRALANYGGSSRDDMTVLTMRVFSRW